MMADIKKFTLIPKKVSFADSLINNAMLFVGCKEDPNTPNRSACVDKIHSYNGGEPTSDPWCIKFGSNILDMSLKEFGLNNPVGITYGTSDFLNRAKKAGLTIDGTPARGSLFYYSRGKGLGHMGIVADTVDNNIITIEGNTSDMVKWGKRDLFSKDFKFVHIEKMGGFISNDGIRNIAISTGILGIIGAGGFYLWKK